jgi:hypothetical protein
MQFGFPQKELPAVDGVLAHVRERAADGMEWKAACVGSGTEASEDADSCPRTAIFQ